MAIKVNAKDKIGMWTSNSSLKYCPVNHENLTAPQIPNTKPASEAKLMINPLVNPWYMEYIKDTITTISTTPMFIYASNLAMASLILVSEILA